MYQAPPPSNQPLHQKADRYALAVGGLAGLIYGFLHAFEIWPGNFLANRAIAVAAIFLLVPPI